MAWSGLHCIHRLCSLETNLIKSSPIQSEKTMGRFTKKVFVGSPDGRLVYPNLCSNCLAPNPQKWFQISYTQPVSGGTVQRTQTLSLKFPICEECKKKCKRFLGLLAYWPVKIDDFHVAPPSLFPQFSRPPSKKEPLRAKEVAKDLIPPLFGIQRTSSSGGFGVWLSFSNAGYADKFKELNENRKAPLF